MPKSFREALLKGLTGAGFQMKKKGAVLISVRDSDKQEAIRIGERFEALGFDIYATSGTATCSTATWLRPTPSATWMSRPRTSST